MSCGAVLPVSRRRRSLLSEIFPPTTLTHSVALGTARGEPEHERAHWRKRLVPNVQ